MDKREPLPEGGKTRTGSQSIRYVNLARWHLAGRNQAAGEGLRSQIVAAAVFHVKLGSRREAQRSSLPVGRVMTPGRDGSRFT